MPIEYIASVDIKGFRPVASNTPFADDFEGPSNWEVTGDGSDFVGQPSPVRQSEGYYSFQLQTRTSGASDGDTVQMVKRPPLLNAARFRFGCDFLNTDASTLAYITFQFTTITRASVHDSRIRLDRNNGEWQAWNSSSNWVNITGASLELSDDFWVRMAFIINLGDLIYEEIIYNGESQTTGFPDNYLQTTNPNNDPRQTITIITETNGANSTTTYIDNIFIEIP